MIFRGFTSLFKDITGGNAKIKKSEYLPSGKFPIIDQGKDLIGGYSDLNKTVKRKGEVIVFGDHTGCLKYVDFDFLLGADGVKVIQPNYDNLDTKYAYYLLQKVHIPDTGYDRKFKYLKRTKIPLPPVATQKKIAAILDAADAHRQKTRQLLAKYDELAQSIFLEMFGDPVTNPKGWEVKKLGDLGNWKSGGTPTRQNPNFFDGNIPWLSSGELEEMYVQKSKEFITQEAINGSAAKIIEEGSLLLGMYDTAALKSTITTFPCSCNQAIAFAMLNPQIVNTEFVFTQIQQAKEHFRRLQRGVRQKNLNLSMVKDIRIMVPPIDLQTHYAEILKGVRKQRQSLQNSLLLSENLFNSFLQNAFNGELV